MKREIKFRAWDSKQNYMAYQGTPDLETLQSFMYHFGDSELMQYIGVKDKDGKDIYEGDILQYKEDTHLFNWLVESKDGQYVIVNIGVRGYLGDRFPITKYTFGDRHIIGNIYETPKLLENE